jgi:hypothetical protein
VVVWQWLGGSGCWVAVVVGWQLAVESESGSDSGSGVAVTVVQEWQW